MQCTKPYIMYHKDRSQWKKYPYGYMELPCGQCQACKIRRTAEWSLRLMLELEEWENSYFLTLTYDDTLINKDKTLVKSHVQKFFKRLRKSDKNLKIKYYLCGEYGDQTFRPHYHTILYANKTLTKDYLESIWYMGFIHVGTVTPESTRYVAQYIDKKYNGELAEKIYAQSNRIPPFQLQSKGIGLSWALKNTEQLKTNLYISTKGIKQGLPRYFKKKLSISSDVLRDHSLEKHAEILYHYYVVKEIKNYYKIHALIREAREQNNVTLIAKQSIKQDKKKL